MGIEYLELAGWMVAAIGAALAIGTAAAWWTYRRTGSFPGSAKDSPPPNLAAVAARVVVGVVVAAAGIAWAISV